MTTIEARQIIKAINRHARKAQLFAGGRQWGVDYATWAVSYPQMAAAYSQACEVFTGRKGRFIPRF